jgi:Rieske Fe-S protein
MAHEPDSPERRDFLRVSIIAGVGVIAFGAGLPALLTPAGATPAATVPAAPLLRFEAMKAGEILAVELSLSARDGWRLVQRRRRVFVRREAGDEFHVLSSICPHAGCEIEHRETTDGDDSQPPFECPCHGARFDAQGNVLEGPAAPPMDRLEASVQEHEGQPWLFVTWRDVARDAG